MAKVEALKLALSGRFLRRSIVVMALVGIILNTINQSDAVLAGKGIDIIKCVLTFCVPFCVSTFASWSAILERTVDGKTTIPPELSEPNE